MFWRREKSVQDALLDSLERASLNPDAWRLLDGETHIRMDDVQISTHGNIWQLNNNKWGRVDLNKKQAAKVSKIFQNIVAEQARRKIERSLEGLKQ